MIYFTGWNTGSLQKKYIQCNSTFTKSNFPKRRKINVVLTFYTNKNYNDIVKEHFQELCRSIFGLIHGMSKPVISVMTSSETNNKKRENDLDSCGKETRSIKK